MTESDPPRNNLVTMVIACAGLVLAGATFWTNNASETQKKIDAAMQLIAVNAAGIAKNQGDIAAVNGHLEYSDRRLDRIDDKLDRGRGR